MDAIPDGATTRDIELILGVPNAFVTGMLLGDSVWIESTVAAPNALTLAIPDGDRAIVLLDMVGAPKALVDGMPEGVMFPCGRAERSGWG